MSKYFARLALLFIMFVGLGNVASVKAQTTAPTPTTEGGIQATPTPESTATAVGTLPASGVTNPNIITMGMLNITEIKLTGPYDTMYFSFGLPADWKLKPGGTLNLRFMVAFTGRLNDGTLKTSDLLNNVSSGNLTVRMNGKTVKIIPIENTGEAAISVVFPSDSLVSTRADGRLGVELTLESLEACGDFGQMNLVIHDSSYFDFPHDIIPPVTDLTNFPRPLYQGSFIKDTAMVVIPENPTAAELQSALTVSAGLGARTYGGLVLDLTTDKKLTTAQQKTNHIIYVAKAGSLPNLDALKLPLPLTKGSFNFEPEKSADIGVVQMVNSPWDNPHSVLLVSGNTDQGIIKAAQAVSTGFFRTNIAPNLALVDEVRPVSSLAATSIDRTLTDMGYSATLFSTRGTEAVSYTFDVMPGWTLASDASFDLIFGNSALLNYTRSGITIYLNNTPVGSVRLSDATAGNATNKVNIKLPAKAAISGKNSLVVQVTLFPIDDCTPPNSQNLWVNVWPESLLHLPLTRLPSNPVVDLNLGIYPAPYTYYPELDNNAFVLQKNDPDSWRSAMLMAYYFGSQTNGVLSALSVFYGDNVPTDARSKYNLIVIGQPDQMPILKEMNSLMPIPFADGSNQPKSDGFQVKYIIPASSPMGYLETFFSPWNPDRVVLAVLGNTAQGVKWAANSLTESTLRSRLSGNFAVIKNQQIITTDTRQISSAGGDITQSEGVEIVTPEPIQTTPVVEQRPAWILPTLIVLLVLIIVIIASSIVSRIIRNRRR